MPHEFWPNVVSGFDDAFPDPGICRLDNGNHRGELWGVFGLHILRPDFVRFFDEAPEKFCQKGYTMNEKVPSTASNRRKRELAREGDPVTYKRKRKTIDPSTVVPPNTINSTNEGSEFETESAQAVLGTQPPLPNVSPNFDMNIPIIGGYYNDEGATSNDDIGPSDKSLLRSFRFHRARSIALGQTSESDLLKETIEQMKEKIELKRVVDKQCTLEFTDLPRQLDVKILKCKNLEEKNTSLEAELRQKSGLEDCNQSLFVELNKKCKEIESLKVVNAFLMEQINLQLPLATPVRLPKFTINTTLAKKYKDLLDAYENIKKKLIVKEDFRQKLVNAEKKIKSLEANNSEWGHRSFDGKTQARLGSKPQNQNFLSSSRPSRISLMHEGIGGYGVRHVRSEQPGQTDPEVCGILFWCKSLQHLSIELDKD
ncbi:hypothetical protein GIB67_042029 [Kingdonia uniflora]|uniref:Uncharacterized protein n=1 Tax=Kingdonia uniflora TaxID=39325 RepID=A0A7J7MW81_9MAGN|nr:hypothetical protein GIB67_042029 [Kingdonia uniflora]